GCDVVVVDAGYEHDCLAWPQLIGSNPRLVVCRLQAFDGFASAQHLPPDTDLATALAGIMAEQPALREGPVFTVIPFALFGTALLAAIGIAAALYRRARLGRGGLVETSLLRGVQAMQPRA